MVLIINNTQAYFYVTDNTMYFYRSELSVRKIFGRNIFPEIFSNFLKLCIMKDRRGYVSFKASLVYDSAGSPQE